MATSEQQFLSTFQNIAQVLSKLVVATGSTPTLPSYTVASPPSTAAIGTMIYVTDESGGAVPAFYDGTNWRRVTDRAVIS